MFISYDLVSFSCKLLLNWEVSCHQGISVREAGSTWGRCFWCFFPPRWMRLRLVTYLSPLLGCEFLKGNHVSFNHNFSLASNLCLTPTKHSFLLGTKAMHDIMGEISPALHMIRSGNFYYRFILSSSPSEPPLEWIAEHRSITY